MSLEHELEAIAARAEQARRRGVLAKLKLFWRRDAIAAYRRCFLGEDGAMTADGVRVLADLAGVAKLGIVDLAALPESELRERAGRRQLALHIITRLDLDGSRLRDIATKLRRMNGE